MTTKKKTPRRIELNAGQAVRLQSAEAEASMVRAQLQQADRLVQTAMDAILNGTVKEGEPPARWQIEINGDTVELVEVFGDGD